MFKFYQALLILLCLLPVTCGSNIGTAKKKSVGKHDLLEIPKVSRDKVICFALYTVHQRVLKLTAQFYPLRKGDDRTARLEIKDGDRWREVARSQIIEAGFSASFRVENWDDTKDWIYRVAHGKNAFYQGRVRKNPVEKNEIVVVGLTGNSIYPHHGGDISRDDLIANVKEIDADVLFFSGDQVYDHDKHYAAWLKFGRDFGEIIRDRPTITIPDDHDVGQPNLWGANGKASFVAGASDGGYTKSVAYVQEVERAQTSHLPDPFDPTPILRGIGVYYTSFNWGRISFAILEDRKFKTGPKGLVPLQGPRPDHIQNPDYDPQAVDVPEAVLLGKRQLKFIDHWTQDWTEADFKVALSQTIFCGGAHIHGKTGGRIQADMDSNGWPQSGRNRAVRALRKGFAFHLAGDQHLATIFHHGVNEPRDGNYSFCVPSIANLYLRWWKPLEEGRNREPGKGPIFGDHKDGFGNHVTCLAVANPDEAKANGDKLTTRAAGFGVVRFHKNTRKITMECWGRNVDVSDPNAKQCKGWPRTIDQQDNYGREALAWLPTLKISGRQNPVVQVVDEGTGDVVYTLRILGNRFRPKVFRTGTYTIHVGEGTHRKTFRAVAPVNPESDVEEFLEVTLK